MSPSQHSDCLGLILDVLCYELIGHRLSPEMETLIEEHVENCPGCKRRVDSLRELIEPQTMYVH